MRDVVVGAITNYGFEEIKVWVNSLDRSGFTGVKAMICYNIDFRTMDELTRRGYLVFSFDRNERKKRLEYQGKFNICVERFLHTWQFFGEHFKPEDMRYLIATDVRDVVFQRNPSTWLEENLAPTGRLINAASESLRYQDEAWGTNNLRRAFGETVFQRSRMNLMYNAGTLAGSYSAMLDLFLTIYHFSKGAPQQVPGGGGPDQAALNILLQTEAWRRVTNFARSEDGWAAQLGTTADPRKLDQLRPHLLEPEPQFQNGEVFTSAGQPFAVVHQYDRVPAWRGIIEQRYL